MHCTNLEANRWPPPPPPSDVASGVASDIATVASSNGDAWGKEMQQDRAREIIEDAELIEEPTGFELSRRRPLVVEQAF